MFNFNFSMPDYYWKITAGVAALDGLCAFLNIATGEYFEALLWLCLAISQLEIALYQKEGR